VGLCLPGTPPMNQTPLTKVAHHDTTAPSPHRGVRRHPRFPAPARQNAIPYPPFWLFRVAPCCVDPEAMVLSPNGDATMVPILPKPSAFVTIRLVPPRCSPSLGTWTARHLKQIGSLGGQCGGQHAGSAGDARRRYGGRWQNASGLSEARGPGHALVIGLIHRLGLTLTQQAVDVKTNEIKAIETVAGADRTERSCAHDGCATDSTTGGADDCRQGW